MHPRLVEILACPVDKRFPLALETDAANGDDVVSGRLACPECGHRYPIVDGFPDLLPPDLADEPASRELSDQLQEIAARDFQAAFYDRWLLLKFLSWFERRPALRLLSGVDGGKVVELGCGTGRISRRLAPMSESLVAVDFSMESLRLCRRNLAGRDHVDFVRADVSRLPFRDGVFDKALSCQVFEHLPSAEIRSRAVAEAERVLASSGAFVLSVYRQFWFSRQKEGYHDSGIYYYRFTPVEFRALLSAGFNVDVLYPNIAGYVQLARGRKRPTPGD